MILLELFFVEVRESIGFDMRKRAFHLFGMLIFALDMQFSLQLYGLSAVIETIDHRQAHSLQLKLVFIPASKAIIDDCLV